MSVYKYLIKMMSPVIKNYHRLEVFGMENIPRLGDGFIITPNHSGWFGWDAAVISSILENREIHWVAWSYEGMNPLWDIAVKASNGILCNNRKNFPYEEVSEKILKKGNVVGIFPEGNSNPVGKWYRLRPFLPGCVRLSILADVPILPVAVSGLEEASPMLWGKEEEKEPIFLMIALPVVFPTKVIVHFGKPLYPDVKKEELNDKNKLYSAAQAIQLEVLKLLKRYRPNAYAECVRGEKNSEVI